MYSGAGSLRIPAVRVRTGGTALRSEILHGGPPVPAVPLAPARTPDGAVVVVSDRVVMAPAIAAAASGWRGGDRRAEADRALAEGLAGYVRAVAAALNVGAEATAFEVSDTATAYLALSVRSTAHPGVI